MERIILTNDKPNSDRESISEEVVIQAEGHLKPEKTQWDLCMPDKGCISIVWIDKKFHLILKGFRWRIGQEYVDKEVHKADCMVHSVAHISTSAQNKYTKKWAYSLSTTYIMHFSRKSCTGTATTVSNATNWQSLRNKSNASPSD